MGYTFYMLDDGAIDRSHYKIIESSNLQEIFSSLSKCKSFAMNPKNI